MSHWTSVTKRDALVGVTLVAWALVGVSPWAQQPRAYRIGSPDVLEISVWGQSDLSGRYGVAPDGTIAFPLIGHVPVAGLTPTEAETQITTRLADGYLKDPQVTITVAEHRSQRIFVVGEVQTPGVVALTGDITLLEALARAGSLSDQAGGSLVVIRPGDGQRNEGPLLPGEAGSSEVLRVEVRELQTGRLDRNLALRDGDTIFVSRAETIFVLGQVNSPGEYTIEKDMTVLRALSLAGGATRLGATNRVKIIRIVEGQKNELKADLNDPVLPGDTIMVPTRFI